MHIQQLKHVFFFGIFQIHLLFFLLPRLNQPHDGFIHPKLLRVLPQDGKEDAVHDAWQESHRLLLKLIEKTMTNLDKPTRPAVLGF